MRVLVCGDRKWENYEAIFGRLRQLPEGSVIIEGEAPGADRLARRAAEELGLSFDSYPANWDRFGRGAGRIRNRQMLRDGLPDLVLAFHSRLEDSKGTLNMVAIALQAGVQVEVMG